MGNTCKPMAVSFQCMTKSTTIKKKKKGLLLLTSRSAQLSLMKARRVHPISLVVLGARKLMLNSKWLS